MERAIEVGKKYKHFKGHIYVVIAIGKDADDLSDVVVYQNVETNEVWVRKLDEFASLVDKDKYPEVDQLYRFEEVE